MEDGVLAGDRIIEIRRKLGRADIGMSRKDINASKFIGFSDEGKL